jgi:hypothetical protein
VVVTFQKLLRLTRGQTFAQLDESGWFTAAAVELFSCPFCFLAEEGSAGDTVVLRLIGVEGMADGDECKSCSSDFYKVIRFAVIKDTHDQTS